MSTFSKSTKTTTTSPPQPRYCTLPTQQGEAFTYALYLHREELRRSRSSVGVKRTKLLLTQELISKTIKNINKCSADDLQILSRETIFKKNLHREIARQRHRHYLHMLRLKNQQQEIIAENREYLHGESCRARQELNQNSYNAAGHGS
ncbi:uncharacterized protein LOC131804480 [Musca domestica]|uniref:Uncharacterized protein LOC131804480 n=1 Tax=Musca domestica TaxID=7370 RepID=A0ABM3VC78_MUSDO|nr:uncharacterized protein LOC131804480 [Musca domestica]